MKNLQYIFLLVAVFAYFWKKGKDEISNEGKEPESFKHSIQRGFYETVVSFKTFHQDLGPEQPEINDPEDFSNFVGVRAPAHRTGQPHPKQSRFKKFTPKKRRGAWVDLEKQEERELASMQAEATERINNLY